MPVEVCQEEKVKEFLHYMYEDSIPNDGEIQKIGHKLRKLALEYHQSRAERKRYSVGSQKDIRFVQLSEGSKDIYLELLENFKNWKPRRENLIKILKSTAKNLERNSTIVSSFRIITSAVDIFGNLTKGGGKPDNFFLSFAIENVTLLGVMALLFETGYFTKTFSDVKKAIAKDQECYKEIIKWYEKTKELDEAIESLLPYGIDADIAKKINNRSSDKDDAEKIFMTIVASNGKNNYNLLDNEDFIKAVDRIAGTEAGKLWYHKTILQDVPYLQSIFESSFYDEVRQILAVFRTEDRDILLEASRNFTSKTNMKIAIDMISIISCCGNVLYGSQSEVSKHIENFQKISEEEFKTLQNIVLLLKPSELEMDPILQGKKISDSEKQN